MTPFPLGFDDRRSPKRRPVQAARAPRHENALKDGSWTWHARCTLPARDAERLTLGVNGTPQGGPDQSRKEPPHSLFPPSHRVSHPIPHMTQEVLGTLCPAFRRP